MKETKEPKQSRIEARVSTAQKSLFQQAAQTQGRSLSEFIIAALQEQAERVIRDQEILRLSEAGRRTFVDALLNPPEPGEALLRARDAYRNPVGR